MKFLLNLDFLFLINLFSNSQELIIGEERVEPGVIFIFEGAIKDHVMPMGLHLAENETNIHIEARLNWDTENIPDEFVVGYGLDYAGRYRELPYLGTLKPAIYSQTPQ